MRKLINIRNLVNTVLFTAMATAAIKVSRVEIAQRHTWIVGRSPNKNVAEMRFVYLDAKRPPCTFYRMKDGTVRFIYANADKAACREKLQYLK